MRVLVVGGTRFVGKHIVDALLQRGHEVTLFNRGTTRPGLFAEVERVVGDRNHDLTALAGRAWDTVIDTCAYVPRQVRTLLHVVGGSTRLYVLISTISAYAGPRVPGITEDAPLAAPPRGLGLDPPPEAVQPSTYGPLKAMCERVIQQLLPDDCRLVVRPGLVVGPEDHTWRFSYWVHRVAHGGRVLAPAPASRPLQVVDARDLAMFVVRSAENAASGTVHVTGPAAPMTFGQAVATMSAVADGKAEPVWVDPSWLVERGVDLSALPLTLEPGDPVDLLRLDIGRALASGLSLRPIGNTVADTLAWIRTSAASPSMGLDPHQERELIRDWEGR